MKAIAACLVLLFLIGFSPESTSTVSAKRFVDGLSADQRAKALYAPDSVALYDFHFVPRKVPGITWKELTPPQRELGSQLLRDSLSKAGYAKIEGVRSLEPVLREIENGNPGRDDSKYGFAFFGAPSDTVAWAWRYEGHHLSLTFAFRNGKLVASTPQFLGTNPAEVRSGPSKGTRVLAKEQDIAFELLNSLDAGQKASALVGTVAPSDILTVNAREAKIQRKGGIAGSRLTPSQRAILERLLRAHAEVQSVAESDRRIKQVMGEMDSLLFVWMGSTTPGKPHYYRIQGKDVLVEYDNTQNGANHIHSVWRNTREDFGTDPLKQHYDHSHRH